MVLQGVTQMWSSLTWLKLLAVIYLVLGSSQFRILPELPQKVVKRESKMIYSLCKP